MLSGTMDGDGGGSFDRDPRSRKCVPGAGAVAARTAGHANGEAVGSAYSSSSSWVGGGGTALSPVFAVPAVVMEADSALGGVGGPREVGGGGAGGKRVG